MLGVLPVVAGPLLLQSDPEVSVGKSEFARQMVQRLPCLLAVRVPAAAQSADVRNLDFGAFPLRGVVCQLDRIPDPSVRRVPSHLSWVSGRSCKGVPFHGEVARGPSVAVCFHVPPGGCDRPEFAERHPAQTGFHVCVDPCSGPPALSGFPVVYNMHPAWTGFHVSYSVFIIGPPALSGFPSTHNQAFGIDRLPCLCRSF